MCDDSLENQISRSAEVGDKLVTSSFRMTPARGFCCEKEPGLAVCLLPGTEIAFEEPVRYNGLWGALVNFMKRRLGHDMSEAKLARFRQVDLDNPIPTMTPSNWRMAASPLCAASSSMYPRGSGSSASCARPRVCAPWCSRPPAWRRGTSTSWGTVSRARMNC